MKKQDKQTLPAKTTAELIKMQTELQSQLTKAHLEKKAGKLSNTSLVKTLADDLARVKTALRWQELVTQNQPANEQKAESKNL